MLINTQHTFRLEVEKCFEVIGIINILALWPCQLNKIHKTNRGYKHNDEAHFTFDLTFRMLQHTSSEVTVEQIQI